MEVSMRGCGRGLGRVAGALALAWGGVAAVQAATVTVGTPFINLESRGLNSIGFTTGNLLRIGASSVVPNGAAGTTGVGTHVMPDGSTISRVINFSPAPVIPNFFSRYMTDSPALRGDWTLTFTNGSDSTSRNVRLSPTADYAPFVNTITLTGSSRNPTFTWAPPPGATVNGYRVNIYDKSLITSTSSGQVMNRDLPPGTTSYTVADADFSVAGYGFTVGKPYAVEISLIQTKDGTSNTSNANIQAIARTYADFTAVEGGDLRVQLPVVREDGAYVFSVAVVPGETYYIDPEVAVGYDYAIGAGDPFFASVILPTGIGDGLYDIYGYDSSGALVLLADNWAGGASFSFGAGGVSRFRVMDIETSAMLDPANVTAFVTGLTFTGAGMFTGTQTPITVDIPDVVGVPEPASWALWLLGAAGLVAQRRRRSAPTTARP